MAGLLPAVLCPAAGRLVSVGRDHCCTHCGEYIEDPHAGSETHRNSFTRAEMDELLRGYETRSVVGDEFADDAGGGHEM